MCLYVVFNPLHKYHGGGDLALSPAQFSDSGTTIAVNMPGEMPAVEAYSSEIGCRGAKGYK